MFKQLKENQEIKKNCENVKIRRHFFEEILLGCSKILNIRRKI